MDHIGVTEMQSAHAKYINKGVRKANRIGRKDEGTAESCGHNHWVVQRIADSNIAIKGHGGEKETFCGPQENEKVHLGEAAHIGNILAGGQ